MTARQRHLILVVILFALATIIFMCSCSPIEQGDDIINPDREVAKTATVQVHGNYENITKTIYINGAVFYWKGDFTRTFPISCTDSIIDVKVTCDTPIINTITLLVNDKLSMQRGNSCEWCEYEMIWYRPSWYRCEGEDK